MQTKNGSCKSHQNVKSLFQLNDEIYELMLKATLLKGIFKPFKNKILGASFEYTISTVVCYAIFKIFPMPMPMAIQSNHLLTNPDPFLLTFCPVFVVNIPRSLSLEGGSKALFMLTWAILVDHYDM